jgi:hypothetical protein
MTQGIPRRSPAPSGTLNAVPQACGGTRYLLAHARPAHGCCSSHKLCMPLRRQVSVLEDQLLCQAPSCSQVLDAQRSTYCSWYFLACIRFAWSCSKSMYSTRCNGQGTSCRDPAGVNVFDKEHRTAPEGGQFSRQQCATRGAYQLRIGLRCR